MLTAILVNDQLLVALIPSKDSKNVPTKERNLSLSIFNDQIKDLQAHDITLIVLYVEKKLWTYNSFSDVAN